MPAMLLTRQEVEQACKITKSTLYRLMREGRFPLPRRIGVRAVRWEAAEIQDWIGKQPRSDGDGVYRRALKKSA